MSEEREVCREGRSEEEGVMWEGHVGGRGRSEGGDDGGRLWRRDIETGEVGGRGGVKEGQFGGRRRIDRRGGPKDREEIEKREGSCKGGKGKLPVPSAARCLGPSAWGSGASAAR